MTQYLLAILHAGAVSDLPLDEWRQSLADVGPFNAKLANTGALAFAGGLLAAEW